VLVDETGGVVMAAQPLANRYFLLRHGQSVANVDRLIASSLANAGAAFGLTQLGRDQVRRSTAEAKASGTLGKKHRVITSPLLRARESAEVASDVLGGRPVVDDRLIERSFGSLELSGDSNYEKVWDEDGRDPSHELWGVESLRKIANRASALLVDLERTYRSFDIILCTHGDVASTLWCTVSGIPLVRHREVGALDNGELRALTQGAGRS
jgi:probable phosphoglycerate mutase